MKSPREQAARALCRLDGNPEDDAYRGRPMWMSYLLKVDAVLGEALEERVWRNIKSQGPFTDS